MITFTMSITEQTFMVFQRFSKVSGLRQWNVRFLNLGGTELQHFEFYSEYLKTETS